MTLLLRNFHWRMTPTVATLALAAAFLLSSCLIDPAQDKASAPGADSSEAGHMEAFLAGDISADSLVALAAANSIANSANEGATESARSVASVSFSARTNASSLVDIAKFGKDPVPFGNVKLVTFKPVDVKLLPGLTQPVFPELKTQGSTKSVFGTSFQVGPLRYDYVKDKHRVYGIKPLPKGTIILPQGTKVTKDHIQVNGYTKIDKKAVAFLIDAAQRSSDKNRKRLIEAVEKKFGSDLGTKRLDFRERTWFTGYGSYAYGPNSAGKGRLPGIGVNENNARSYLTAYQAQGRVSKQAVVIWGTFLAGWQQQLGDKNKYLQQRTAEFGGDHAKAKSAHAIESRHLLREARYFNRALPKVELDGGLYESGSFIISGSRSWTFRSGEVNGAGFVVPVANVGVTINENGTIHISWGPSGAVGVGGSTQGALGYNVNTGKFELRGRAGALIGLEIMGLGASYGGGVQGSVILGTWQEMLQGVRQGASTFRQMVQDRLSDFGLTP